MRMSLSFREEEQNPLYPLRSSLPTAGSLDGPPGPYLQRRQLASLKTLKDYPVQGFEKMLKDHPYSG